jgi:hypothetical protein
MNRNTRPAFALAALLASCATTATPAAAGGWTNGERCNVVVINLGEIRKDGNNAAPNSSTNSPTNTPEIKPVVTPSPVP